MKSKIAKMIAISILSLIALFSMKLDAQITSWSSTTSLPATRQYASAVVWNGRIYVTGGDESANWTGTNTVYRATINIGGSITGWTTSTMPVYKAAHSAVVWNGYLYVIGGYNDWGSDTRSVRYAPINADGSIGTWSATTDLPAARIGLSATVWNGRIYVTGGASGVVITARNSLYIGTISGDGSIPSWTSTTLPAARAFHVAIAINNRLYIIGGGTADWSDENATTTVYFAPINADGSPGGWSLTTELPAARNRHGAFYDAGFNRLYIVGGRDQNGNTTSTVWYAPVNADGTLGAWSAAASLPEARKDITVCANPSDNWRAYVIGGTNASNASVNTVWYSSQTIAVEEPKAVPLKFALHQNHPNPFNSITNLKFHIPVHGFVNLKIFDILGQEVATLVNEEKSTGYYEIQWNASNLPSGVYFYRLQSGTLTETKKLLLLR